MMTQIKKSIAVDFPVMNSLWESLTCDYTSEDMILFQAIATFKPFFMREMRNFTNVEFSDILIENYRKIVKEMNEEDEFSKVV